MAPPVAQATAPQQMRLIGGVRTPHWLEPVLFPEEQTSGVAAALCISIAGQVEMHRVQEATTGTRINRIANLVCVRAPSESSHQIEAAFRARD